MNKLLALCLALGCAPLALAVGNEKELDRIKDADVVMKEILDIPDDIPRDLLDRAECVIVIPSVLKAAFVVGGSYGRGAVTCRSGDTFRGAVGRADDDGSGRRKFRLPARRLGHRLC